jgi:predicted CxxxxCH...CXXCH cytochrome family protein
MGEFPVWADTVFKVVLIGIAVAIPGLFVVPLIYVRTPYNLNRHVPVDQPVPFDHRHHAGDDGIAGLYCHDGAERTPFAGVPATEICMGCHSQIWNTSAMLEPVRRSYFSGKPIAWNRVNAVPDFVYFDHSAHVTRARLDCATCHGDVISMPAVERTAPFTMGWCLDCHRARAGEFAPATLLADLSEGRGLPAAAIGGRPAWQGTPRITNCSTCHR